jgi:putative addiction module component (TIGR02574 family)
MNKASLIAEIMQMNAQERRELMIELCAVVEDDEAFALTPEQMAEIDRRMAAHERDPGSAIPWEEARDRLLARFG